MTRDQTHCDCKKSKSCRSVGKEWLLTIFNYLNFNDIREITVTRPKNCLPLTEISLKAVWLLWLTLQSRAQGQFGSLSAEWGYPLKILSTSCMRNYYGHFCHPMDLRLRDVSLTIRFQVAVRLFSNRSQMTSKCVRTKKWHTRRSRVCHWCSYHILTSSVIYYWTDARQLEIYLFYIIKN